MLQLLKSSSSCRRNQLIVELKILSCLYYLFEVKPSRHLISIFCWISLRGPAGFDSVSEYYAYLSQKLRTEGVDIDCIIPQLEQRLGVQHPLMDALEKCLELNGNNCQWKSGSDN